MGTGSVPHASEIGGAAHPRREPAYHRARTAIQFARESGVRRGQQQGEQARPAEGKPTENQEDVQVVRYSPGGFYNAHYDACEGDDEHCRSFVSRGGQRYATLLVYLSDDFSGGGTDFPKINYTAAPKEGDAIFFHSTDETGKLFKDSQHGGQPVEAGNKWIANIWVRHAKYRNAPTPTT